MAGPGGRRQCNPSWNGSQASVQMYNGAASIGGGLEGGAVHVRHQPVLVRGRPHQERNFLHLDEQEQEFLHQHPAVGQS